jgi:hypothetical protein
MTDLHDRNLIRLGRAKEALANALEKTGLTDRDFAIGIASRDPGKLAVRLGEKSAASAGLVPKEFDGFPIDVRVVGDIRALAEGEE